MFKFLLSMLLALHTFPCFLSPFVWNSEKFHSKFSSLLNLLQVQLLRRARVGSLCPAGFRGAQQGLGWLEMQLGAAAGGIPEQHTQGCTC